MTQQPRILVLFGPRVLFGAERENMGVLTRLREQGCEILCLVRHEDWNDHVPEALASRGLVSRKVPYIDGWLRGWRLWTLFRNPIAHLVGNIKFLKTVREFRPTHIHAYNPFHVFSFLPGLLLVRTPLIFRVEEEPARHRWIWRMVWRFTVARTRLFVPVSHFLADRIKEVGVKPEKIEVIHGHAPARPPAGLPDTVPPPDNSKFDIVYVGQIIEAKGVHLLVEAFRQIAKTYPSVRLLIAGRISEWSGDQWARDLRDSVVQDPSIASRVFFLGFIEDVLALLRGRQVLVVPSLVTEGLPLVALEAKTAGVPAVVFACGGLPEAIEQGKDGFVCSEKSAAALIGSLKFYLDNPSAAAQHGLAALASHEQFSGAEFAHRWYKVYEGVR